MSSWFPYLIGAVGLTIVIVLAHITWPIRYWGCTLLRRVGLRLPCPLYCTMCTGVWVGAGVGAVRLLSAHGAHVALVEPVGFVIDVAAMAFATSVVSFVVSTWLRLHGEVTTPEDDERKRKC